jgi:hypothetical protein
MLLFGGLLPLFPAGCVPMAAFGMQRGSALSVCKVPRGYFL